MNITNKLFGSPLVIGVILVAIMVLMTLPLILQLNKSYKWLYFGCITLAYLLLVPTVMVLYEYNSCKSKIYGGTPTQNVDFGGIFDIQGTNNVF